MSVIVVGMDMPKDCLNCPFSHTYKKADTSVLECLYLKRTRPKQPSYDYGIWCDEDKLDGHKFTLCPLKELS